MPEGAGFHQAETGGSPTIATVFSLLNPKAVGRALQSQADRLGSLVAEKMDVLPTVTQELIATQ